ncbi:hypothetical protein BPAE_0088g00150 [Botrytis paeoniae]|uniref:Uncharacterized protein n=1 Tax=Botrytis paeoniae TaxID=278948 RepID=A0A4Z1FRQ1_9HELO|nr:hypothetical protein BPAE_0088g00150 [Botrytis paeoniae]
MRAYSCRIADRIPGNHGPAWDELFSKKQNAERSLKTYSAVPNSIAESYPVAIAIATNPYCC